MIENWSFRIFLLCMLLCASTAMVIIWLPGGEARFERLIPTFFIIGFASFLIWVTRLAYRFLEEIEKIAK